MHHRQVVHGALRPHHLTVSRAAKVSISGWGWLRTSGIPAFGDPVSTSVFNPPEHDGQSSIDGRADVYALGAIAYRALTGVFPDVSRDLLDARSSLGAVIENMLALDARERSSAASVIADLDRQRHADHASSRKFDQRVLRNHHGVDEVARGSRVATRARPVVLAVRNNVITETLVPVPGGAAGPLLDLAIFEE